MSDKFKKVGGKQLQLFESPRPLLERLGEKYFAGIPRGPGVYIMTGEGEKVLYVGKSRNLRARLGTYKNARADFSANKILRLVREAKSLSWERCENETHALLRENSLLRLHRPKFNVVNTYPPAYSFLFLQERGNALEIGRTRKLPVGSGCTVYGAFKASVIGSYNALVRSLWTAVHQPKAPAQFPFALLGGKVPPRYEIRAKGSGNCIGEWLPLTNEFLAGHSARLIPVLKERMAAANPGPFLAALQAQDLEWLEMFYKKGPQRNTRLQELRDSPGGLITQEELDDLIVNDNVIHSREGGASEA